MRSASSMGLAAGLRKAEPRTASRWRSPSMPKLFGSELIEQTLHQLSRPELERLAERVIDMLDSLDADQDLEPCGDEIDGTGAEDDFACLANGRMFWGPGCEISDAA